MRLGHAIRVAESTSPPGGPYGTLKGAPALSFPHTSSSLPSWYLQGCPQLLGIEMGGWPQQRHHNPLEVARDGCLQGCQQVLQAVPKAESWA